MGSTRVRLAVNAAEVASKVIDGEAIAIHLNTGAYYSLDGTGARIWGMLEQGVAAAMIVQLLTREYLVDEGICATAVDRLLSELGAEGLIVETTRELGDVPPAAGAPRPWTPPVLNIYRDMADLLALDPPVPGLELAEREDGSATSV